MKLTVLQENLTKALSIASRSVATRAQLPVLSNVLLSTEKGRLKLSATNLEIGISYWVGAKIEKQGAISVPARVLTEFVSSLPAEKVEIVSKDNNLKLICGSCQANFVGLTASEFPTIPAFKGKTKVAFNSQELATTINQIAFAAAQDESNPVLAGVLLMVKDNSLFLVATDGYRLSLKKIKGIKGITEVKELKKGLLIPAKTLIEVGRIIGEEEKGLGLAVTSESNQVIFVTETAEIASRLIEGKFPDFEKILPEKGKTKVIMETEVFQRAVRAAAIFARESANIIRLKISSSGLEVSANTAQVGENKTQIEAKVEGKKNKIAFNSRYLLDFLNSTKSDLIEFEMTGPLNPGVFSPVGVKDYTHIIMPVRVQE